METAPDNAINRLKTPLTRVPGFPASRVEPLQRLGLNTVRDVLFYFPRTHEDLVEVAAIADFQSGKKYTTCGVVEEIELRSFSEGRTLLGVLIRQENDYLRAVWFNQPFMQHRFQRGQTLLVTGTARLRNGCWEIAHPDVHPYDAASGPPRGNLLPVYSLTQGLSQPVMRRLVRRIVEQYAEDLEEVFPAEYLEQHRLLPIHQAVQQIHMPRDAADLEAARRRFIYQELLVLQIALAMRRQSLTLGVTAPELPLTGTIRGRIERTLGVELTRDQQRAIEEIAADLARPVPMNRLLQGDVGTGKTLVAMFAMLQTVAHGYQAVLMAPTELLARQHLATLERRLTNSRVRLRLLTGQLTKAQRLALLEEIGRGEVDIVVGTHAIANAVEQDSVQFARLGLVVIDEQHKFGVAQRARMKQAGQAPHYLVMTATPIPRTITMTLFGDLDVSVLREGPAGRQPVHTYLGSASQREAWWDFFRRKLREGRQGYVVSPLVEENAESQGSDESEEADEATTVSAERAFEQLACDVLEEFRVDLVHGRMPSGAKQTALEKFASGETQVLVATSVIEVGIDVPNATLMTIESAERFGLAQLHQLRGRVSRGIYPGYVCVFGSTESDEIRERLERFCSTSDGFALAEADLELRGPGDLFGTRQHGLPPMRVADLRRDQELLEEARRDAQTLVAADPQLADPAWHRLRRMVLVRYGSALELSDVG